MRKKLISLTFLFFFVFGLTSVAVAGLVWHPNNPPQELDVKNWVNIADTLKLTDEQTTKILGLQKAHHENNKALRAELQDNVFALKQLQWQKNVDQKIVKDKVDRINDLRAQLYNEHQKFRQELDSTLTPEQRDQLKSICKPKGMHQKHKRTSSNLGGLATA